NGCQEMISRAQPFFTPDQRADECALQKECEHALHCQSLSDHAARIAREAGPVRSELKLHGDTGDDTHCKIDSKDFGPESSCLIVLFVSRPQCAPFPIDKEPRQ